MAKVDYTLMEVQGACGSSIRVDKLLVSGVKWSFSNPEYDKKFGQQLYQVNLRERDLTPPILALKILNTAKYKLFG